MKIKLSEFRKIIKQLIQEEIEKQKVIEEIGIPKVGFKTPSMVGYVDKAFPNVAKNVQTKNSQLPLGTQGIPSTDWAKRFAPDYVKPTGVSQQQQGGDGNIAIDKSVIIKDPEAKEAVGKVITILRNSKNKEALSAIIKNLNTIKGIEIK